MATFQIHEDVYSTLAENKKPKNFEPVKSLKSNIPRVALQPIHTFQQNAKRPKPVEKDEAVKMPPVSTTVVSPAQVEWPVKTIRLKPVFKKNNLIAKANSFEKEYEDEILEYLFGFEKRAQIIKPYYMTKQLHLNWEMRSVLVDWLVSVAHEYKMSNNTVHLTVNYLDRFLSNISVIRSKFQLVGATAMMIAGKVEDVYPPDSKEWSYLTRDAFSVNEIHKMEQFMLRVLNFEMNPPTILDFIKRLCSKHKVDKKTTYLAMYLSELVLLEGDEYLQHFPSKLAAASLALARHTLAKPEPWNRKLEETAGYTLKQLSPVVQKQHKTFKSSPFKEQQAIQKKYASVKYQRVALLKPRILQLDDEE
ncbi:G2/mitotic-specific cyclin-A [Tribolium castaneum]|uniref:G2/mitotic-specific cyclin-A-like Protein n=1 Tax=Tribolium castaneum TaxID=7070 RepID=D6WX89_TRICA|nr:PREDICTED: G2/mitotic-specific cyclin-A [Tribolium castaneum]EFA08020.1 G2/mitotic-specific cyclin-A-like Protein [Tribolium castaneum]|eukprot:XP_973343.1 PREDICTED: G2/mitotic-specific cyclin-A [Tribolium castaneum]